MKQRIENNSIKMFKCIMHISRWLLRKQIKNTDMIDAHFFYTCYI